MLERLQNFINPSVPKPVDYGTEHTDKGPTLVSGAPKELKTKLNEGMNRINTATNQEKWVPAKGQSAFSQVFKVPDFLKNGASCIASSITRGYNACKELSSSKPNTPVSNQSLASTLSPKAKEVFEDIKKFGMADGFKTLGSQDKISVLKELVKEMKNEKPNETIMHVLLHTDNDVGKTFDTVCKNGFVSESLNFIRDYKSYQKNKDPEKLANLKATVATGELNLAANLSKTALGSGNIAPVFTAINKMFLENINTHINEKNLEKKDMPLPQNMKEKYPFGGDLGDSSNVELNLFKPKT